MPLFIGLFLAPCVLLLARESVQIRTSRKKAVLLNCLLILIVAAYYIFVFTTRIEPFDFEISYSMEYMMLSGKMIANAMVVYVFSPFMWIITIHFARNILRSLRIRKNASIKREADLKYYREDLDKVAPGIILFTSQMSVDMRRCISSGILKLKLAGAVAESGGRYVAMPENDGQLLPSEGMLLGLVRTGKLDENAYRSALEKEALEGKYLVRNRGNTAVKLLRLFISVCIPVILIAGSVILEKYAFENYRVYPEKVDGGYEIYIILDRDSDVKSLMEELTDLNHVYGSASSDGRIYYSYYMVKADQLQYSAVKKAYIINAVPVLLMIMGIVSVFAQLYSVVSQIQYFSKKYRRTAKGNNLVSKAYALKNFLKDYSLMSSRSEAELPLWEHYLVYAVALGVNESIEDEVMERL